jgi:HlyD family type I secretion membrane fusion protein
MSAASSLTLAPADAAQTALTSPLAMSSAMTLAAIAAPSRPPLALDTRMRGLVRRGLGIVVVWVGLMVAWALLAPISGGVVASGQVKVEANRRVVTHRDGGTVARIDVHEGQLVQRGDVLIELEDVRVDASVDLLRAQLAADKLRESRLETEAASARNWQPPAGLLADFRDVKRIDDMARKEAATFAARQANLLAQIAGDERQADSTRTEIAVRLSERDNAGKALKLMQDELAANQTLEQQQFVNRTRVMTLQRSVSEYQSRQLGNEADLAQARQRLEALQTHMRTLRDAQVQSSSEDLRDVQGRISDTEQRLRSSSDDQSRQKVLAPEAGRLVNLRINTVGSALGAREPIVDIVPQDAPLRVEARLPLEVAADIKVGTPAELRVLTAQTRYEKLLPGEVVEISADALQDERTGAPYLSALVQVPAAALAQAGTPLRPGMAAEVYIKVAERTPMGFLTAPVTAYFRRAFREH